MTSSPSRGHISNKSKKIQKSSFSPSLKTEKDSKGKTYATFNNSQKELILDDLRKGVSLLLNLAIDDEALLTKELLVKIDQIKLDKYNNLLKKVLSKHVENFKDETKVLTQWRKKVKSWITNTGKPETRGGLVVAVDRQEEFRQRVIQILNELPFRCFQTLKNRLLEVLEEFHNASQDNAKPFNSKTCSKHWWFNFINKNADIKEQWESILLERSVKKIAGKKSNSIFSSPSREDTESSPIEEQPILCESTAMGSQGSSPVCENDQNAFDHFHYNMEEETLPDVHFMRFDSYAVNQMTLYKVDTNAEVDIDQFFNTNEAISAQETQGGSGLTLYDF